ITTLSRKIESLAIIILPFTILSIVLLMTNVTGTEKLINMKSGLGLHVLVSLLAYSTLMLASFQSILLAAQNNHLHNRQNTKFIRTLPSLEDMEHFLFRLIAIGVILLSFSLLSGFYFLDNLFGSHVAHKTILSIISWIIFTALLWGRWKYGWRGKTAVRWTLVGFFVLALAFFGSKFIQEYILEKETTQTNALHLKQSNS
ncbi:MAG: cytochrome c biogenesis protein CcsA, partial [Thiotrichaceae bacterium]